MTYQIDIINIAIKKYIDGYYINRISKELNIHVQTLYKWFKIYPDLINERTKKYKTIQKIKKRDLFKNEIINYVEKNNGCSLIDISNNIDKKLSLSSICRVLQDNNITHKKINNQIIFKTEEKINEERILFSKNINIDDIDNSIYIDESSFCCNDLQRYGYSIKGKKIKRMKHQKNRERYSLLMAISNKKIESYKIIKGSIDSNIYLDFYKENNKIFKFRKIYQDNARIHHAKIVKNYCIENKIDILFNPAYSPDFNPIECIFSKLKTLYRKLEHNNIIEEVKSVINKITESDLLNCYNYTKKFIENYI